MLGTKFVNNDSKINEGIKEMACRLPFSRKKRFKTICIQRNNKDRTNAIPPETNKYGRWKTFIIVKDTKSSCKPFRKAKQKTVKSR